MVHSCSAYNCTQRQVTGSNISFHKFPSDLALKKKWLIAIKRDNFQPSQYSRLCSKHFSPDCFIGNGWTSKKALHEDAVPSIFDFPEHMLKSNKKRILSVDRTDIAGNVRNNKEVVPEEVHPTNNVEKPSVKQRRVYIGDFKGDSSEDPKFRTTVMEVISRKNKQIKDLQQKNRRLVKRVTDLTKLSQHVQRQNLTNTITDH